jgi:Icc-related predicted phosphoesterase
MFRVAAMADLHCTKDSRGQLQPLLQQAAVAADVLLLCGDLTDYGLPEEAHTLAHELSAVRVPLVAVLGNHDFESGKQAEISHVLAEAGVKVLDGDAIEIGGVGFAGVKGFCGGFGRGALGAWGEATIKQFVREAVDEAMKLEAALARLRTPHRFALLHYSPIRATVEGEPVEIFAYLGSSRLAAPLTEYKVSAVFHGHAHRGTPEGTLGEEAIPVYNVALPLMRRVSPDGPMCRIVEMSLDASSDDSRMTADQLTALARSIPRPLAVESSQEVDRDLFAIAEPRPVYPETEVARVRRTPRSIAKQPVDPTIGIAAGARPVFVAREERCFHVDRIPSAAELFRPVAEAIRVGIAVEVALVPGDDLPGRPIGAGL